MFRYSVHLRHVQLGYFAHLIQAWRWAFILIVHGLYPDLWPSKVSDELFEDDTRVEF